MKYCPIFRVIQKIKRYPHDIVSKCDSANCAWWVDDRCAIATFLVTPSEGLKAALEKADELCDKGEA